MKRILIASALALALAPAPAVNADPPDEDYRCEPIAVRAVEEANKELEAISASSSPTAAARATGQACALIKNALDNMYLLKCSAELTELVSAQYKKQRNLMDDTNSKLDTSARCVFGGGYGVN